MVYNFSGNSGTWQKSYDQYDKPYDKPYEKPYEKVFDKDYTSSTEAKREEPTSTRTGQGAFHLPVNRSPVSDQLVIEPIDFNDSQKMADYLCSRW